MNLHKFTRLGLVALIAAVVPAITRADDAKLLKKSGSVTISGVKSGELKEGDLIPQGATITTGNGSEAFILTAPGTVANVKANTEVHFDKLSITKNSSGEVTKQVSHLALKQGNVVALIDHANKDVNDFQIETPQGVAKAKGTAFSVVVDGAIVTIVTTANSVSFTRSSGADLNVASGYAAVVGGSSPGVAQPLSSLVTSNPEVAASLPSVIAALSTMISQNMGGLSASALTELSAQVVAAASVAQPSNAATYASQITTAMSTEGSTFASSSNAAINSFNASLAAAQTTANQPAANVGDTATPPTPTANAGGVTTAPVITLPVLPIVDPTVVVPVSPAS